MNASFMAKHLREPRSRPWANAVATAGGCTLLGLCAYSSAVPTADWTVSGIVGATDISYWRAHNHENSASSLWEMGLTPVVELRRAPAAGASYYVEAGIGVPLGLEG